MYFDSHAHYDDKMFDADRDLLLHSLREGGVDYVIDWRFGSHQFRQGDRACRKV